MIDTREDSTPDTVGSAFKRDRGRGAARVDLLHDRRNLGETAALLRRRSLGARHQKMLRVIATSPLVRRRDVLEERESETVNSERGREGKEKERSQKKNNHEK